MNYKEVWDRLVSDLLTETKNNNIKWEVFAPLSLTLKKDETTNNCFIALFKNQKIVLFVKTYYTTVTINEISLWSSVASLSPNANKQTQKIEKSKVVLFIFDKELTSGQEIQVNTYSLLSELYEQVVFYTSGAKNLFEFYLNEQK